MAKKSGRSMAETSQKGTALAATVFLAPALIMIGLYMIYPSSIPSSPASTSGTASLQTSCSLAWKTGKRCFRTTSSGIPFSIT